MAAAAEQDTCMVCIDPFTKQPHRKQAHCPYCDVKACVKCTQAYLIGTHEDAHCMGCRRGWTREVMDTILLSTWLNGEYKKHRQNVLLDREKSRLPAAQLIVERRKQGQALEPERVVIADEIAELERQINAKRVEYYRITRRIEAYYQGIAPGEATAWAGDGAAGGGPAERERRVFIMPCPASECRGFLSQSYKCGVCDIYCCPDCREIKGFSQDAAHTCDANTVATVRAMKKDTRPCPECGISIFKIEGCNMMFCTGCHTPFDWVSGKKITHGAIHNPHYFEYLRATNGGHMPRNPGDIPCAGNLPTAWAFDREVSRRFPHLAHTNTDWLFRALRVVHHIQQVEIPNQTNNAQDIDNTDLNVRYITKEIDEARWKQLLQMREKRRIKRDEIRLRFEAFVGACADIFGRLMAEANRGTIQTNQVLGGVTVQGTLPKNIKEMKAQMTAACEQAKESLMTLRTIFNEGQMDISKRYKCQVMQLGENGIAVEKKKYTSGRMKKAKQSEADSEIGSDSVDLTGESSDDDVDEVVAEFARANRVVRQQAAADRDSRV